MVEHLTRVILEPAGEPAPAGAGPATADEVRALGERARERAARVAGMMEALAADGFTLRWEHGRVLAESRTVEAQDAKRRLLALGYRDREFQVFLEYVRKWGIL